MDIVGVAQRRYATKVFDKHAKLSDAQIKQVELLLQLAPSSTNAQPWHYVLAASDEGKALVAQATTGAYASNAPKLLAASHVLVLCSRVYLSDDYLQQLVEQEAVDGRLQDAQAKQGQYQRRAFFVDLHRYERRDIQHWLDKQVYLALGHLLLGVAALGIDACPIEGFDAPVLDEVLGLRAQGLCSTVVVALGQRDTQDANAQLPKSRWPIERIITRI